jgi:hypothetical protein
MSPEIAATDATQELTDRRGDVDWSHYRMSEFCNAVSFDTASSRIRSAAYGAQVQILREQHEIPGLNTTQIEEKVRAAGVSFNAETSHTPQPDWWRRANSAGSQALDARRSTTQQRTCLRTKRPTK